MFPFRIYAIILIRKNQPSGYFLVLLWLVYRMILQLRFRQQPAGRLADEYHMGNLSWSNHVRINCSDTHLLANSKGSLVSLVKVGDSTQLLTLLDTVSLLSMSYARSRVLTDKIRHLCVQINCWHINLLIKVSVRLCCQVFPRPAAELPCYCDFLMTFSNSKKQKDRNMIRTWCECKQSPVVNLISARLDINTHTCEHEQGETRQK